MQGNLNVGPQGLDMGKLSTVIDCASSYIQDIESGIEDGTYEASENKNLPDLKAAVDELEKWHRRASLEMQTAHQETTPFGPAQQIERHEVVRHALTNFIELLSDPSSSDRGHDSAEADRQALVAQQLLNDISQNEDAVQAVDDASETLIGLLDASGSLESESIQRAAYMLRLAVAQVLGDESRAAVAEQSLAELTEVEVPRG